MIEGIKSDNKYALVRELVSLIPKGSVASYGMVASLCAGVTPRLVGFVMAGLPAGSTVPWQRVINASGGISPRPGADVQRFLLQEEGIVFMPSGAVPWSLYAWSGPPPDWFEARGLAPEQAFFLMTAWPQRQAAAPGA